MTQTVIDLSAGCVVLLLAGGLTVIGGWLLGVGRRERQ